MRKYFTLLQKHYQNYIYTQKYTTVPLQWKNILKSQTIRGHRYYLDTLLVRKISKRHFLKDIENSFQEVTQIGPEPPHFFSFSNISTNRVARDFQNFGRNGP